MKTRPALLASVDAIYSRGLLNTLQGINVTVGPLHEALQSGDFSPDRYAKVQEQQDRLLKVNDLLAHGAYRCLRSAGLVQAWLSVWSLSELLGVRHVLPPLRQYVTTGDACHLTFDDENWAALTRTAERLGVPVPECG